MIADAIYVGDSSVERVMLGDVEVWSAAPPGLPVVTITGTTSTAARDQFRAACVEYGTTYQTVTELPFLLDTGRATRMVSMFRDCTSLTDGNVRCIGKHPNVTTYEMIFNSGLTREPFYDTDGNPI